MKPSSTGSVGQLYSYVVSFDTGFAPNPFWGYCTLATCKPGIRRVVRHGDWVVGTGSVNNVGSGMLVFAMRVDEVLTFEEYDRDPRFQRKRPRMTGSARQRCGDNIYQRTSNGEWRQRRSRHGLSHLAGDLGGRHVLVGREFYYWGCRAIPIPPPLQEIVKRGPGFRSTFPPEVVRRFVAWVRMHEPKVYGEPAQFKRIGCECKERSRR